MSFPLYFDEDQIERIATQLTKGGYDVLTTKDAGRANQKISDPDQLEYASSLGRAIVTNNAADYWLIARQWADEDKHHAGIIVVSPGKTQFEIRHRLERLQELYPDGIPDHYLPI